jgi:hypothetical protein
VNALSFRIVWSICCWSQGTSCGISDIFTTLPALIELEFLDFSWHGLGFPAAILSFAFRGTVQTPLIFASMLVFAATRLNWDVRGCLRRMTELTSSS